MGSIAFPLEHVNMKPPIFSLLLVIFLLASCTPPADLGSKSPTSPPISGEVRTTIIQSEGSQIAVMIASPVTPRYTEGAGIVVMASPIFSASGGFITYPDLTALGLIQVSYLWPGQSDARTGAKSSGDFDYGGQHSINILRDVIRFAGNRLADQNNRYIVSLTSVPPLVGEVGVYAFADAGIPAVQAFSQYGSQMQGLGWFIGREVPTVDTISSMELGYYDTSGQPVYNPFYNYPDSYGPNAIVLDYTNLRWDPTYTSTFSSDLGRPFLDLDGNGAISSGDYIFDGPIPLMFGKRYYSTRLTQALASTGAIPPQDWPSDLATPDEAARDWQIRQIPGLFLSMQDEEIVQNMKVMLVFAKADHAQVVQDKPHIHQLYQGFRFEARLWVRLNPDRSYVESILNLAGAAVYPGGQVASPTPGPNLNFPDNPANTQPDDWTQIDSYAYPGEGIAGGLVPLAAVAEMADREHSGIWDENIGQVIYIYPPPTPQP